MTEQIYAVKKVTIKSDRIWLTIGNTNDYDSVISMPRIFTFIPRKVIITDVE